MANQNDRSIVSRRNFIATTGAATALGIAGCTANDGGNGNGGNGNGGNGGNGNGGGSVSGDISITGSSTVFPINEAMAEEFQAEYPDVNISLESTGSGGGFENFFSLGDSDINGASRPIKEAELEKCRENGVEPIEFQVGGDALTMAVNNEADWVDCMTVEQLAEIWRPDGAETWADVDPDWPDEEFELGGPADTSGTFDWFTENIIGEAGSIRSDYEPTEDDNTIVQLIQGNQYAMGFFGYAYYDENEDSIKGLEIDGGSGCTPPGLENAKDGSYPMARPLFIYANEEYLQEKPQVEEFLRFYMERVNTSFVSDVGYVPASDDQAAENVSKIDNAVN